MVMAIYGLKNASTINYLSTSEKINNDGISYHGKELPNHNFEEEIVRNSDYHFWFRGVKFISLNQLYAIKQSRQKENDKSDCLLMKGLVENNNFKPYLNSIKYKIIFLKTKIQVKIISIIKLYAKKFNVYPFAEKVYRTLTQK